MTRTRAPRPAGLATILPLAAALLAALLCLAHAGCGGQTPQEKLDTAFQKLQAQPPDIFGAINRLKALTGDPKAPADVKMAAYQALANLYLGQLEDPEEGLALAEKARGLYPSDTDEGQQAAEFHVAALSAAGKLPEAIEAIEEFFKEVPAAEMPVPRRTRLRMRLAGLLNSQEGRQQDARDIFEAILADFPDDDQVQERALEGVISTILPDRRAAAERYLAYAKEREEKTELARIAKYSAGVYLTQIGAEDEAGPLLEEYFEREEKKVAEILEPVEKLGARIRLALAYQQLRRFEEQEKLWRDALENEYADKPKFYAKAVEHLMAPLALTGRFDEAALAARSIQEKFPEAPEAAQGLQLIIGMINPLLQMGQIDAAIEVAKAVQKHFPDSPDAAKMPGLIAQIEDAKKKYLERLAAEKSKLSESPEAKAAAAEEAPGDSPAPEAPASEPAPETSPATPAPEAAPKSEAAPEPAKEEPAAEVPSADKPADS